ncbi:MAG: aminotransferase class III-fold pyridoxal phosphate-dependent enzyme [Gemmatimonadetes bacterium]|nr:aminotransferase class III-fold pyridoxal phosphate-dependent enzyme [Gemmatimonadota bacterium]
MEPTTATRSEDLYARAKEILPGGVSRNTVLRHPHPIYVDHAEGCRVVDIEGVERIDFANNMASLIHGHAYPPVVEAVSAQMRRGSAFSLGTEVEIRFAEHMLSRCDVFEKIRFVNSGTEAVMGALKAARAFTGRPKVAKVEGAYHGLYDYAEVSQTASPDRWGPAERPNAVPVAYGTPERALADVVVLPFNDIDGSLAILEEQADELACVLLDVMPHRVGLNPAEPAYVEALRAFTAERRILLVLDEVITFRGQVGGAQKWYHIEPDLTALGKMIGGGFPVGAIAGRAEVMEVMNPLNSPLLFPHSGTFSANPVTMTAGLTAMSHFDEAAVAHVNDLTLRAKDGIEAAIAASGARACVTGGGSMLRVHIKEHPPRNYREAYLDAEERKLIRVLLAHLFDAGIIAINTCTMCMSTVMGVEEVDTLIAMLGEGLDHVAQLQR